MRHGNVELGQVEATLKSIGRVEGTEQIPRGNDQVGCPKHIVNLAGDCMPESWKHDEWTIEKHVGAGQLELDLSKIQLHLSPNQGGVKSIEGNMLRNELESGKVPVLNACVLDYLFLHPALIPEDWKKGEKGTTRRIYFWGTIYRHKSGRLFVRYLVCDGSGQWHQSYRWLGYAWDALDPAAVLASVPQP